MKENHVVMVLALSIVFLLVFFNGFVTLLVLVPYLDFPMLNVVFEEGYNSADYDGATILNCLHGGGCPEGVTYVNDNTGQVESREIVSKKAQPVEDFSPESKGFPDSYNPNPSILNPILNNVVLIDYLIYGMIIILLFTVVVILLKRRSKMPKTM